MPAMAALLVLLLAVAAPLAGADDPYRYFTWTVTYGPISPLGTTQQVWVSVSLPILPLLIAESNPTATNPMRQCRAS